MVLQAANQACPQTSQTIVNKQQGASAGAEKLFTTLQVGYTSQVASLLQPATNMALQTLNTLLTPCICQTKTAQKTQMRRKAQKAERMQTARESGQSVAANPKIGSIALAPASRASSLPGYRAPASWTQLKATQPSPSGTRRANTSTNTGGTRAAPGRTARLRQDCQPSTSLKQKTWSCSEPLLSPWLTLRGSCLSSLQQTPPNRKHHLSRQLPPTIWNSRLLHQAQLLMRQLVLQQQQEQAQSLHPRLQQPHLHRQQMHQQPMARPKALARAGGGSPK